MDNALQAFSESWRFSKRYFSALLLYTLPFLAFDIFSAMTFVPPTPDQIAMGHIGGIHSLLSLFLYPLYVGGMFILIAQLAETDRPNYSLVVRRALMTWIPFFFTILLTAIAVSLGMLAFIIPGIWLAVRLTFAQIYVAVERRSPFAALSASFKNTKKNFWVIFIVFGLVIATSIAITIAVTILFSPFGEFLTFQLPMVIINKIIGIFFSVVLFRTWLLYVRNTAAEA